MRQGGLDSEQQLTTRLLIPRQRVLDTATKAVCGLAHKRALAVVGASAESSCPQRDSRP
jgi:hypothetical protein